MLWTPDSWRHRQALQQPNYPDPAAVDRVLLVHALEMSADPMELLREACRLAYEVGGYDRAAIFLVGADGRTATP